MMSHKMNCRDRLICIETETIKETLLGGQFQVHCAAATTDRPATDLQTTI